MTRYLIILCMLCSCVARERTSGLPVVKTFESEYGGVGYDILLNEKVVIHQPTIPALAGNTGFPTEKSARQVATLVIQKIKNGQMPPSVTTLEVNAILHRTSHAGEQGRR